MKVRHILGLAIFCGASGALGGQGVRAQSNNSLVFVQMLLVREARQISAGETAIARQNQSERLISLLEAATPTTVQQARQLNAQLATLEKNATILQSRINITTSSLLSLNGQLSATLVGLGNPSPYTQLAAQNAAVITTLAARPPFGIPPVTSSQ